MQWMIMIIMMKVVVWERRGGKVKVKEKSGRRTRGRQAKIVRQMERVDPMTGKGRSKTYGFLEMNTHADVLRVLRWTNNHPGVGRVNGFDQGAG